MNSGGSRGRVRLLRPRRNMSGRSYKTIGGSRPAIRRRFFLPGTSEASYRVDAPHAIIPDRLSKQVPCYGKDIDFGRLRIH